LHAGVPSSALVLAPCADKINPSLRRTICALGLFVSKRLKTFYGFEGLVCNCSARGRRAVRDLSHLTRFLENRSGNVALTFALLTPVLFLSAGIAIDFQARLAQKASLQDAADTLSLRGAR
jgi:hypothetical protein